MAVDVGDEVEIAAGPFQGVYAVPDPGAAVQTRLFDALNMFITDVRNRSAIVARHGMQGQTQQLGTTDARAGQCLFTHRSLDGTVRRFAFAGGRMYLWDGVTTFTDITPAGIAIHATNPIFCTPYNDEIIVTDENNKPWIYTPKTGAAAVIEFNDVHEEWATKGGYENYSDIPTVALRGSGQATLLCENGDTLLAEGGMYDGFDLTTELTSGLLNSITWANANDARTGYDQGAFDHVWTLTQTSGEVLGGLRAEEGSLTVFRNVGIGYITGEITDDWRGQATRDGISQTRGTDAPAAMVSVDKRTYFLDLDGRLFRSIPQGGEPDEIWFPYRRDIEKNFGTAANRANVVACARAAYVPMYDVILFTIWDRQTIYAFHARSGTYLGQWSVGDGIHIDAMGQMVDAQNRSVFVIIGTRSSVYSVAQQGIFWRTKYPEDASRWLDQADASVGVHIALTRAAETQWLNHRVARTYRATRITAELLADNARHGVRMQYKTSGSALSAALVAQSTAVTGEKDNQDSFSVAAWSPGKNAQGRGLRVRLSATHADNVQFGVHSLLTEAIVTQARTGNQK